MSTPDDESWINGPGIPDHLRAEVLKYYRAGHAELHEVRTLGLTPLDELAELYQEVFVGPFHHSARSELSEFSARLAASATVTTVAVPGALNDPRLLRQFSGGDGHRMRCAQAAAWFEQNGNQWTADRERLRYPWGDFADVAVPERGLYAEAGNTVARKLTRCIDAGFTIMLLPHAWLDHGFLIEPVFSRFHANLGNR